MYCILSTVYWLASCWSYFYGLPIPIALPGDFDIPIQGVQTTKQTDQHPKCRASPDLFDQRFFGLDPEVGNVHLCALQIYFTAMHIRFVADCETFTFTTEYDCLANTWPWGTLECRIHITSLNCTALCCAALGLGLLLVSAHILAMQEVLVARYTGILTISL